MYVYVTKSNSALNLHNNNIFVTKTLPNLIVKLLSCDICTAISVTVLCMLKMGKSSPLSRRASHASVAQRGIKVTLSWGFKLESQTAYSF